MIKLAENVVDIKFADFSAVKIMASIKAYGFDTKFFTVWVQYADENISAVIAKLDNAVTVSVIGSANFEELEEFLNAVGFDSLFCSKDTAEKLDLYKAGEGYILKYNPGNGVYINNFIINPSPVKVYEILDKCRCTALQIPPFESFYTDFSHRMRHGAARSFVNSDYSAVAFSAESDTTAFIGGVAVLPTHRGQGIGGRIVKSLADELANEGKEVYVSCLEAEKGFYEKTGFIKIDEFAILKGKTNA